MLLLLRRHGYSCSMAGSRAQFEQLLSKAGIVVIDLSLKETDAILLSNEVKLMKEGRSPFVVIVGDKTEDYTEVTALDLGADDYIIKPIKAQLFIKRLEVLCRRSIFYTHGQDADGSLFIDHEKHLVWVNRKSYTLPKKEFELLGLFNSAPNKIFARQEIAVRIWGEESIAKQRTIDVHIRNIRKLIRKDLIKTVKGLGYGLNKSALVADTN